MSEVGSVSNLSSASSRSEHMAYLMGDLNLDRSTAALMYRAERLQEKGQLQQALRSFERVLATKPDCEEAAVNARMIREQMAQEPRLETVREEPAANATAAGVLQTVDWQVKVVLTDSEQFDVYYTEAMLKDQFLLCAKKELRDHGIQTPFVQIVAMDVEPYTPSVDIDPWMNTSYTCRGVVRATLLPGMVVQSRSHDFPAQMATAIEAEAAEAAVRAEIELALLRGLAQARAQPEPMPQGEPDTEPSIREQKDRSWMAQPMGSEGPAQSCAAAAVEAESVRSSGSRHSSVRSN